MRTMILALALAACGERPSNSDRPAGEPLPPIEVRDGATAHDFIETSRQTINGVDVARLENDEAVCYLIVEVGNESLQCKFGGQE